MEKPKIISLGMAVPDYIYTQREMFNCLQYPRHYWGIFASAQIDKRHFCVPVEKIKQLSFQEQQEQYLKSAIVLSEKAFRDALDSIAPESLGLITYATCSGFPPGPTIPHYIAKDFALPPDTQINNL